MATTVSRYVQGCQTCQTNNQPTTRSAGKQCLVPTIHIHFKLIIVLDHVTMPDTGRHRCILNVIDFATSSIVPTVVGMTSTKVLAHLSPIFNRCRAPDIMDYRRAFQSQQFTHFMQLHGIQVHHSVAHHVRSNACVECSNGTLVSVLQRQHLGME